MVFFATQMEGMLVIHGDELWPFYADYEKVITHCIQHSNFREALNIVTKKAEAILELPEKQRKAQFKPFADLIYKFSPALVKEYPIPTVQAWIKMGRLLESHKLIPALVQCNQLGDSDQVWPYLSFSREDSAICTLLGQCSDSVSGVLCR